MFYFYLFGSSNFVLENGLTFADYARAGFFQLTAVLILVGCLLALLNRSFSAHGHDKLGTILKVLLIVQVEIIAISALRRMNLYQDEYGYTTLRLYVEWFIYFVMIFFVAFAVCVIRQVNFRKLFCLKNHFLLRNCKIKKFPISYNSKLSFFQFFFKFAQSLFELFIIFAPGE